MTDADNAFGHKQALKVKKQKKSQGSSRYRPIGAQELVALALLKGSMSVLEKKAILPSINFLQ